MKKLIIVAHPDDEILGCGGTIALNSTSNEIHVLILGEGVTSRNISNHQKEIDIKKLIEDSLRANKVLGVKSVFFEQLPDNKFDTIPLLDIVKIIENYIHKIKPSVIFTHHYGDLNIDHQITNKAVITATRPIGNDIVLRLLACEILSSTEWNFHNQNLSFIPNIYVDISNFIEKKLEAMKCYENELREYPNPRSLKGIRIHAQKRGLEVGFKFAEAFCLIREINSDQSQSFFQKQ